MINDQCDPVFLSENHFSPAEMSERLFIRQWRREEKNTGVSQGPNVRITPYLSENKWKQLFLM